MDIIKTSLDENQNFSAFRFITVDAYLSAIDFYKKNGFMMLSEFLRQTVQTFRCSAR